ncbi:glycosyl transferase, family 25 [Cohaesibacter sp. ES.047]|nr:glycosyl transferase, family 25 [Cohaesibacter sp. ES.047]
MRIFLINLDRDADRLDYMNGELAKRGFSAERIPAVYGLDMPQRLKPFFLDEQAEIDSAMNRGEVGCYASHLEIMHRIVEDGIDEPVCVMEDDLEFHDGFAAMAENHTKLPGDWEIVRLSNPPKAAVKPIAFLSDGLQVVKYWRVPNNTGCYLINRSGAEKFLSYRTLRKRPVDEDLRRPWEHGLKTYGLLPAPVTSNIFDSTLTAIGGDRSLPGRKRFKDAGGSPFSAWTYRISEFGLTTSLIAPIKTMLGRRRKGQVPFLK